MARRNGLTPLPMFGWLSRGKRQSNAQKELWETLSKRLVEISGSLREENEATRRVFQAAIAGLNKQLPPSFANAEEQRLESTKQALKEALRQQLGTSEPGEIKRILDSISESVVRLLNADGGNRLDQTLQALQSKLDGAFAQVVETRNILAAFERLQQQADAARSILAENERFLADKERFLADQTETKEREQNAQRSQRIAERSQENALEDRRVAEAIRLKTEDSLTELEDVRSQLKEQEHQLRSREDVVMPKERVLQQRAQSLSKSIRSVLTKRKQLLAEKSEWEANYAKMKAEIDSQLEQVEIGKRQALEKQAETAVIYEDLQTLLRQFWPDCLLSEQWEAWRNGLQKEAIDDADAAALIAAIHVFAAGLRSTDHELLLDSLRQIGLLHYRWLRKRSLDESALYEHTAILAKALNDHAEKRYRLEVPKPGQPTIAQWMNFKTGLNTVGTANNWAVYDSTDSLPHHKAIVQAVQN